MRTKKLKLNEGFSMSNGICLYSKRHRGCAAITIIDEEGKITSKWIGKNKENKENKESGKKKVVFQKLLKEFLKQLLILSCSCIISLFITWGMIENTILTQRILYVSITMIALVKFSVGVHRTRKNTMRTYKFHSAEHMVFNAYHKLQRVPSLEELREYSRFSNNCGTNITTQIVMSCVLLFCCTFISDPLYRIIGVFLSCLIVFILLKTGKLNFLQLLTTIIPTDVELEVAIEAIKTWLENEQENIKEI